MTEKMDWGDAKDVLHTFCVRAGEELGVEADLTEETDVTPGTNYVCEVGGTRIDINKENGKVDGISFSMDDGPISVTSPRRDIQGMEISGNPDIESRADFALAVRTSPTGVSDGHHAVLQFSLDNVSDELKDERRREIGIEKERNIRKAGSEEDLLERMDL